MLILKIAQVIKECVSFEFLDVLSILSNTLLSHHILMLYSVQKETQCFYLQFLGLKVIDFKNCFNSAGLPSNKDLDCIVSS